MSAAKLCEQLAQAGFDPWLDKKKLLPGQNWPRAIETAIQSSEFVIACFSRRSVAKSGCFQCELRYAMQCAARIPLDEIFLIPARLEPCAIPAASHGRFNMWICFPIGRPALKRSSRPWPNRKPSASLSNCPWPVDHFPAIFFFTESAFLASGASSTYFEYACLDKSLSCSFSSAWPSRRYASAKFGFQCVASV